MNGDTDSLKPTDWTPETRHINKRSISDTDAPNHSLRQPMGVYAGTREQWLNEAANLMTPMINYAREVAINELDDLHAITATHPFMPHLVSYSCSLLSGGTARSAEAAHCQTIGHGDTIRFEIRMGVQLGGQSMLESARVADILIHEILHSMARGHGHRGGFPALAKYTGLEGKMTATTATLECTDWILENVVEVLGQYPHEAVHLTARGKRGIGSRMIKVQCYEEGCGCTFRLSRKWIQAADDGLMCPVCHSNAYVED